MDEEPSTGVHEDAVGAALQEVSGAGGEVGHAHLSRRQQVDTGD